MDSFLVVCVALLLFFVVGILVLKVKNIGLFEVSIAIECVSNYLSCTLKDRIFLVRTHAHWRLDSCPWASQTQWESLSL